LAAVQTLVLLGIVGWVMRWFDRPDGSVLIELWALLWLAALSGVSVGLTLSSMARSTDQAVSLTPVVLLPQVIFSGIFSAIESSSEGLKVIARCMSSNWCFGAAGHVVGLGDKLAGIGLGTPVFDRLPSDTTVALLVLIAVLSAAAFMLLMAGERR